jgi:magnesium chelatase family protein
MLARTHTFTIDGLSARRLTVEVDVRSGLPGVAIIGLGGAAVRQVRERVRTAILNSGFQFPPRRITVNLTPADMPKAGPGLDLALACAVLAATGQLPRERLATHALLGELALDGRLAPSRGTLAIAAAAREEGVPALILAPGGAAEAVLVQGIDLCPAGSLAAAARILRGGPPDPAPHSTAPDGREVEPPAGDLADVRGQHHAVRALVLAAAGGHNLLLTGAPGTGKTMLARRLPGLLPPPSAEEALRAAVLASVCGHPVRLPARRP